MSAEPAEEPKVDPVEPVEPDPVEPEVTEPVESKDRVEVFDAVRPDGVTVTVTRNLDTGEQSVEIQE